MNDLLFEYKVICNGKEIKLYSTTDIEEFLVRNGYTKYVRDVTDTFENRLLREIERLKNIIKEVREYIELWHYRNDFRVTSFTTGVKKELLEILDKEVN